MGDLGLSLLSLVLNGGGPWGEGRRKTKGKACGGRCCALGIMSEREEASFCMYF